jgi:hypothetical protein
MGELRNKSEYKSLQKAAALHVKKCLEISLNNIITNLRIDERHALRRVIHQKYISTRERNQRE